LPGLAILTGLTLLGFYSVWKIHDRPLAAALGAMLAAILISQQFTSFTLPNALFFYLTVAFLVGRAFEPVPVPAGHRRAGRILGAVLAVPFVAFAVALFLADAGLARVDRLIRDGKARDAAAMYQRLEPRQPPGMRTDLWYSRAIARAAPKAPTQADGMVLWQQGLAAAVRASRHAEDRQNAWLNLAVFYGRQNDYALTEQSLRAAIESAPNWFKPHWLLAQVLRAGGRLPEADVEASLALRLDGGKNPEVARTAQEIRTATGIFNK
jgi:tetratricopeptide (TPR) repeat protein